MKRLVIASILLAGALFLFAPGSNSSTVSADEPYGCNVEGVTLPSYGPYFDFEYACGYRDKCGYLAENHTELFLCDQQLLSNMMDSCNGTVNPTAQPTVKVRSSFLATQLCKQTANYYYYAYRLASIFHNFEECMDPVSVGATAECDE